MDYKQPIFFLGIMFCMIGLMTLISGQAAIRAGMDGAAILYRYESGNSAYIYGLLYLAVGAFIISRCKEKDK